MIIPTAARVPTVPPLVTRRSSGSVNSITVPRWAANAETDEGRMSSGWLSQRRVFAVRDLFHGVFEIITETTNGKWRLSFDDAAPHQMQKRTICEATIRFSMGKRKTTRRKP